MLEGLSFAVGAILLAIAFAIGRQWFARNFPGMAGAPTPVQGFFGLLVSLSWFWLLLGITEDLTRRGPLSRFDVTVLIWFHARATPSAIRVLAAIGSLGSLKVMIFLLLGVAVFLLFKKCWFELIGWMTALLGCALLMVALKFAIQRQRPIYASAFVNTYTDSFPSGHAMISVVGYGMLVYLTAILYSKKENQIVPALTLAAAMVLIVIIGFSRIYMGTHYFSDVMGGYAAGLFWLSVCMTALMYIRQRRPAKSNADVGHDFHSLG
jgi:membrane-associated phospholipid phosphatase